MSSIIFSFFNSSPMLTLGSFVGSPAHPSNFIESIQTHSRGQGCPPSSPGNDVSGMLGRMWWPLQTITASNTALCSLLLLWVTTSHWPEDEKSGRLFTLITVVLNKHREGILKNYCSITWDVFRSLSSGKLNVICDSILGPFQVTKVRTTKCALICWWLRICCFGWKTYSAEETQIFKGVKYWKKGFRGKRKRRQCVWTAV